MCDFTCGACVRALVCVCVCVYMHIYTQRHVNSLVETRTRCKHTVGVYDEGEKVGWVACGAAGAAGGGDIRGVQLAGGCKHAVGVCDDGDKAGKIEQVQ